MGALLCCPEANPEAQAAARSVIDKALNDNRVMVFSKTYCPYCAQAKGTLKKILGGVELGVMELDRRADGQLIQAELTTITGAGTVPRVFVDGACIGGADQTTSLQRSGQLESMLKSKNII